MKESLLPELLEELRAVTAQSSLIATVSTGRPNWIASIVAEGVWLETEASRSKGVGPQLVPAWMLNAARSEEHTSELQSLMRISYAVFCLKTKKQKFHILIPNTHTSCSLQNK